jgi:ankyrin repeat protein
VTGKIEIAQLLLDQGAKVNAKDVFGITPLRSASLNGDWNMVKLLRGHGASE